MSESGTSDSSYIESGDYLETYSNRIDTGKIMGLLTQMAVRRTRGIPQFPEYIPRML